MRGYTLVSRSKRSIKQRKVNVSTLEPQPHWYNTAFHSTPLSITFASIHNKPPYIYPMYDELDPKPCHRHTHITYVTTASTADHHAGRGRAGAYRLQTTNLIRAANPDVSRFRRGILNSRLLNIYNIKTVYITKMRGIRPIHHS